jgi:hypothetical protein
LTPQELRKVFEATFASFGARLDELEAQDKANRENPEVKGTDGHWIDLARGALEALDLRDVVNEKRDAPHTSLQARMAEFRQVAVHFLGGYIPRQMTRLPIATSARFLISSSSWDC